MIKRRILALTCMISAGVALGCPHLATIGYAQDSSSSEGINNTAEQEVTTEIGTQEPTEAADEGLEQGFENLLTPDRKLTVPEPLLQDQDAPPNRDAKQFSILEEPGIATQRPSSPLGSPILSLDCDFNAVRSQIWHVGDRQYLLMEGDFSFAAGAYAFKGTEALVLIDNEKLPGRNVNHFAIYINEALEAGEGPINASAKRLLVTISTIGDINLKTDLLEEAKAPVKTEFTKAGLRRIVRYENSLTQVMARGPIKPVYPDSVFAKRAERRRSIGAQLSESDKEFIRLADAQLEAEVAGAGEGSFANAGISTAERKIQQTIFPGRGTVSYGPIEITSIKELNDQELAVMFLGGMQLGYDDIELGRNVTLKAERIVAFVDKKVMQGGPLQQAGGNIPASGVRGIYLESNVVVSDGDYTIRAPRVFYDLTENKALILDAVMYTYDSNMKLPLYVRAEALRQTSATSWEAENAQFTTSEFGEPHFAIAANKITIDKVDRPNVKNRYFLTAEDSTFNVLNMPIGYFPFVAGENWDIPIRDVRGGFNSRIGPFIETGWDMFSVFGVESPENVDITGKLGWLGRHNGSLGADASYDDPHLFGDVKSLVLPYDNGFDVLGEGRNDVNHDGEFRGYGVWRHRQDLAEDFELSIQAAGVSDNTFLENFFRQEADESQQYQASGYLKTSQDGWLLSLLGKTNLNNFTPQLTYLQAPGYVVDKLPELRFVTAPLTIFDHHVDWFSDTSLTRLRVRAGTDTPGSRGFQDESSFEVFGFDPDMSFRDFVQSRGIPTDYVNRLDSRHELSLPLRCDNWLNVAPYIVGRVTAYDRNFEGFQSIEDIGGVGSQNDDQVRLWGMIGTRINAEFAKVVSTKRDMFLNLNGIRHVLEPYVNVWSAVTNIDNQDLPIFDYDVERIDQGTGIALGLRNTLQTKRGGPGRWRNVDWIMLNTRYVFRIGEGFPEFRIPRYYNYHPEYSIGGDNFYSELLWMVSDNLAFTGELTWAEEFNQVVQWRINSTLDHTPRLSSFVNFEALPALSSRILTYGFTYRMTTKYRVHFLQRLDFTEDQSRRISLVLDRKLPRWTFRFNMTLDVVDNEQLFNVVLIPDGLVKTTEWAATPLRF